MYKIKTIAIGAVLAIVSGPAIAALPSTDWVNEQLGSKVNVNQGTENAGYFLQVNDDGDVEPFDLYTELDTELNAVEEELDNRVIYNQGTAHAGKVLQVDDNGNVQPTDISGDYVPTTSHTADRAVVTDASGNVMDGQIASGMILAEQITASKIASNAKFKMDNINLPTPPADCQNGTKTCMLMYSGGYFAWDVVDRDTNDPTDVMPTAGRVSGNNYVEGVAPYVDQRRAGVLL